MRMRLMMLLPVAILAACTNETTAPKAEQAVVSSNLAALKGGNSGCPVPIGGVLTSVNVGFDANGYNRCAHIFNGTFAGYCAARSAPATCGGVEGSSKLVMKWNEEWDRGNATGWAAGPYDAWLDNEAKGTYLNGTPYSEHFKTKWDAGCAASGTVSTNGNPCIWGPFEILMDQGKEDGAHLWWVKSAGPAGYGN